MTESPEALLERLVQAKPWPYPREILEAVISRLDEMAPHLLAYLEGIAAAPEAFEEERDAMGLVFAAFLLAQAREVRAFPVLVSLLTLPEARTEELWGDLISQDMGRILASVYDGNEAALCDLVENSAHGQYVRGATAIQALESLVLAGRIPRDWLENYYRDLLGSKLEREPSVVWDALCLSSAEFGMVSLLPAIEKAFDEELCDPFYEEFGTLTKRAEKRAGESSLPACPRYLLPVTDTIAETESWAWFAPDEDSDDRGGDGSGLHRYSEEEISGPGNPAHLFVHEVQTPYVRETPKTGRNDPCPCGSGKKFKKCCG